LHLLPGLFGCQGRQCLLLRGRRGGAVGGFFRGLLALHLDLEEVRAQALAPGDALGQAAVACLLGDGETRGRRSEG